MISESEKLEQNFELNRNEVFLSGNDLKAKKV